MANDLWAAWAAEQDDDAARTLSLRRHLPLARAQQIISAQTDTDLRAALHVAGLTPVYRDGILTAAEWDDRVTEGR